MILILSNDGDLSCDLVQDWLDYYHHPYLRFNSWQFLSEPINVSLINGNMSISISHKSINLNEIHSIWLRKYGFFRSSSTYSDIIKTKKLNEELINHITKEYTKAIESFYIALRDRNWLTDPRYYNINKLEVLKIALNAGMNVTDTYVVNNLKDIAIRENLISKSVLDPMIASWGNKQKSMMYTVELKKQDYVKLPEIFMPSMLQKLIPKEYEIRVFYICKKIYSMAIFSQDDDQTKIDFRKYHWDKPNRMVPCRLDVELKLKIRKLMRKLHLNCGSLDFIKATDGKIYFLEVNPTGQFGMMDFPCNYGLHKVVAEQLIKMDNEYEKKIL